MSRKKKGLTTRRSFLQSAATASLILPSTAFPSFSQGDSSHAGVSGVDEPSACESDSRSKSLNESQIKNPRVFSGRHLSRISFPLGGIGTGGIGPSGRGNLPDWEIFNRLSAGNAPKFAWFSERRSRTAFPAIWLRTGDSAPRAAILERRLLPPYGLKPEGLDSDNAPRLLRLAEATFFGSFPLARIEFHDDASAVRQIDLDSRIFSGDRVSVSVGDRTVPCVVERRDSGAFFALDPVADVTPAAALAVLGTI